MATSDHDKLEDAICQILAGAMDVVLTGETVETEDPRLDRAIQHLAADVQKFNDLTPERPMDMLRAEMRTERAGPLLKFGQSEYTTEVYPEDLTK